MRTDNAARRFLWAKLQENAVRSRREVLAKKAARTILNDGLELSKWNVSGARPVLKGAASLDVEFELVTERNKSSFRFFKVEVELS